MTIPFVLYIVALVLALVALARSRGQSVEAFAIIALCLGLLWGPPMSLVL